MRLELQPWQDYACERDTIRTLLYTLKISKPTYVTSSLLQMDFNKSTVRLDWRSFYTVYLTHLSMTQLVSQVIYI